MAAIAHTVADPGADSLHTADNPVDHSAADCACGGGRRISGLRHGATGNPQNVHLFTSVASGRKTIVHPRATAVNVDDGPGRGRPASRRAGSSATQMSASSNLLDLVCGCDASLTVCEAFPGTCAAHRNLYPSTPMSGVHRDKGSWFKHQERQAI